MTTLMLGFMIPQRGMAKLSTTYFIFVLKAANLDKPYSMDHLSINLARSVKLL